MSNEAFSHQNPKLLGLGRQFGRIDFEAFGVLSANLSAPILVCESLVRHVSINQLIMSIIGIGIWAAKNW